MGEGGYKLQTRQGANTVQCEPSRGELRRRFVEDVLMMRYLEEGDLISAEVPNNLTTEV